MYKIIYDNSNILKNDKKKLLKDEKITLKIKYFLEKLTQNPLNNILNIKKMKPGELNKFRLKVDNYRVVYSIDFGNKIIIVHRIGQRKDIYKKI